MEITNEALLAQRVNVGDISRRGARRHPRKTSVIMGERRLSYRELDDLSNQVANGLLALGLGAGSRISVLGRNSIEFLLLYFGAAKAGAILCPANPALPESDLQYVLNHAEVNAIFVDKSEIGRIAALLPQIPTARHLFMLSTDSTLEWKTLHDLASGQLKTDPNVLVGDRDVAMIMYTSGTTSAPKGAMLSHLNVTVGAMHNAFAGEMTEDTIATAILPLFHCGQLSLTSGTLVRGGTVVIMDGFNPYLLLQSIGKDRITWMFALPAMYRTLLAHPGLDDANLSSLQFCLYAMAPMDHATLRQAITRLGVRFALTSGQTEAYPPTVVFSSEYQLLKEGPFWGRAMPLVEMAIMDDDGTLLENGEVGEIVYRGPMLMEGYLKDPEATRKAFAGGWFHSGDLGRVDEDDMLLFVDRKKDIIKSGGENVSSIKIERCLLSHPGVTSAAVIGMPNERWGEEVIAAVCLATKSPPSQAELIAYCKATLAPFEVPKKVIIYERLPQTATGKILKFEIRKEMQKLLESLPGVSSNN
ncbi:class I adenylate-forming enzyme family protein [Noviherbaspirillum sedimenti]|nr:AMP-binding protein [Noviherbaspirillum sedimenti]